MAENSIVPTHDAILPYFAEGVTWAVPNVGDNLETNNSDMAELFKITNQRLQSFSNMYDCFVQHPPSIDCVKAHHNLYVRLNQYIDARTKKSNESRLVFSHITPVRHMFRVNPVRYFDMRNRYTRKWVELALYGLSQFAQMSEANVFTNDFHEVSAKQMKAPFKHAYYLMAVELFNIPIDVAGKDDFRLTQEQFDNYNPDVPVDETLESPDVPFFTEDVLRSLSNYTTPVSKATEEDNQVVVEEATEEEGGGVKVSNLNQVVT